MAVTTRSILRDSTSFFVAVHSFGVHAFPRTTAISGPRPLTKLQPDGGIVSPLHRVVMHFHAATQAATEKPARVLQLLRSDPP